MTKIWLIALASLAAASWIVIVVWGLAAPFTEQSRWYALALGIVAGLALLILVALGCRCTVPHRHPFQPSAAGLVVGAGLGLVLLIPLVAFSFVGHHILGREDYVFQLRRLLIALGLVGGIVVFVLIIAGIVVCLKGRRDTPEGDPVPPAPERRKPDPWMYSQEWARTIGAPVTWDNPSVTIWDPATLQEESRFDVVAGKQYKLLVEVQNGSAAAPVTEPCQGATLTAYMKTFGAGGVVEDWIVPPGQPMAIPPIPPTGPGSAVTVDIDWVAPSSGHRCLVFLIHHPDDANFGNNKGQHNLEVIDVNPGQQVTFDFSVWNRLPEDPELRFGPLPNPLARGLRAFGAGLVWALSRPNFLLRRYRDVASPARLARPGLKLGDVEDVHLEVEQWQGRRPSEGDGAWVAALTSDRLSMPVVAWDDSQAAGELVSLEIQLPVGALAGENRSFNVSATTSSGRVVGGVTVLARVT